MVVKSRKNSDGANCPKTSRSFKKISNVPNLYRREGTGVYYLRVKRADREFRRSLRTTDPALAKRRLREFEGKASTLNGTRIDKKLLFEDLAERWLATIKPEMKSSEGQTRLIEILLAQGKAEEAADVASAFSLETTTSKKTTVSDISRPDFERSRRGHRKYVAQVKNYGNYNNWVLLLL